MIYFTKYKTTPLLRTKEYLYLSNNILNPKKYNKVLDSIYQNSFKISNPNNIKKLLTTPLSILL